MKPITRSEKFHGAAIMRVIDPDWLFIEGHLPVVAREHERLREENRQLRNDLAGDRSPNLSEPCG